MLVAFSQAAVQSWRRRRNSFFHHQYYFAIIIGQNKRFISEASTTTNITRLRHKLQVCIQGKRLLTNCVLWTITSGTGKKTHALCCVCVFRARSRRCGRYSLGDRSACFVVLHILECTFTDKFGMSWTQVSFRSVCSNGLLNIAAE